MPKIMSTETKISSIESTAEASVNRSQITRAIVRDVILPAAMQGIAEGIVTDPDDVTQVREAIDRNMMQSSSLKTWRQL